MVILIYSTPSEIEIKQIVNSFMNCDKAIIESFSNLLVSCYVIHYETHK